MHTTTTQNATLLYKFRTKPYKHQLEVFNDSKAKKEYAFFMEMGTGKSKVAIDTGAWLYDQGEINSILIICPKGAYNNWFSREIPIHMPNHVRYCMAIWNGKRTAAQKREMQNIQMGSEDLRIFVVNVESLATKRAYKASLSFIHGSRCLVIIDESTTIKNPRASRTKAVMSLGRQAHYKRILSGQPIANSPLDIYSQMNFLGEHILGFSSFYSFRNRYAIVQKMNLGNRSFNKVVGYQRLDELEVHLKPWSCRITKDECLDLPEKVYTTREVEMPKEQRQLYDYMRDRAILSIEDEDCTATNVLTQLIRLHQISCGHVTTDDGNIIRIDAFRFKELLAAIEEMSGKIIIWATYRADIKMLIQELTSIYGKDTCVDYYGDTKDTIRVQNIERFQGDDKVRFFVGNPQTGGMGITLTASSTVIYYSNSYNLEHRIQSEDRAHRIGQTNRVTYVDLICLKTVDEKIVKALRAKKQLAGKILGDDWKAWI
ncbi:MAG TPA: DEAD/DEAH box helicase [Flavobacteriales bacterium]|nr:DEAD/DEAH box helicase [Flavobacteriales bacterium]